MPTRTDITNAALSHLGEGGSKFNEWYYGHDTGLPWCAVFQCYVASYECDADIGLSASAADFCLQFEEIGYEDAQPGDYVFFGWDGIEETYFRNQSHVAMVTANNGDGTFDVVEGNNSQSLVGTNTYTINDYYYVAFYRPSYDEEEEEMVIDKALIYWCNGIGYYRTIDKFIELTDYEQCEVLRAEYKERTGRDLPDVNIDENWVKRLKEVFN